MASLADKLKCVLQAPVVFTRPRLSREGNVQYMNMGEITKYIVIAYLDKYN